MTQAGGFSDSERLARLRLARTDGIGAVGFARLVERHGSGLAAIRALEQDKKPVASMAAAEAELARAAVIEARHCFAGEDDYPPLLGELADPPPLLLMVGDPAIARRPVVAIVGARNASAVGRQMALELAHGLGEAGIVVASGMARGVDTAAHRGALASGTIACVAGGVDIAYPPENADLQWAVAEQGLLVSEAPPGTSPMARHFPRRNRLIAGASLGVVVIEAAMGSGSLITARIAGEAGRDVLAVPGHPRDPRSKGGNALIRDGAVLVEGVEDVLAALGDVARPVAPAPARRRDRPLPLFVPPPAPLPPPEGLEGALLGLLSVSGVEMDELVRSLGVEAGLVQSALAMLEVDGQVVRLAGGRVARAG